MTASLRLLIALLAILCAALPTSSQATACQFGSRFASLVDSMPDLVGACVADEQVDALTENRLLRTRAGLLVASTLGAGTAFTDGTKPGSRDRWAFSSAQTASVLLGSPTPSNCP
jgi:hypothetical protein